MAVEIGDDKRIGGKFVNGFIVSRRVIANIAGGVGYQYFWKPVFWKMEGGVKFVGKEVKKMGRRPGKIRGFWGGALEFGGFF